MSKAAIGIIAFAALIGTPVLAADMPLKAPPPPPPVSSWTGFYLGGNVGYSWGDARTDLAGNGNVTNIALGGLNSSFDFADSNTARPNGVIGGGQIGYNYQISPKWVLGFEADIQGSGQRGSGLFADTFVAPICFLLGATCLGTTPFIGAALTSYESKIDWFGTVRGRVGLLLTDQLLVYGTGGLAYGEVEVSGNTNLSALIVSPFGGSPLPFMPNTGAFGASKTNVGFSVGGGVEGNFSYWLPAKWTWKLEYLYIDLGSLNATTSFAMANTTSDFSPAAGTITTHTHFTDNIVRVGLNYQFGN
jgi:outer membrane immunogenic protein